ncbi:nucleotide sugar dehydrogenase [Candidatus Woesearchaeota archaeon]|nr:nucleotide sugar dehydrogenase [Candidatus Woesearchaeota archaeon]
MKVAVIGLGKAGLPLASVIADSGMDVVGVDISDKRVQNINKGINPIPEEKGLSELIGKYGGSKLKAVNDYKYAAEECNAYIVIVPLFIGENKVPDFSNLKESFKRLAKIIKDHYLVVLETTVPPGTTENLIKPILDKSGKKYFLAYSPERIMTGYSISRYKEFPKVIGGIDKKSGKMAFELYSKFCKKVNLVSDVKTAELIKVAEGVYRDVNIALANELYQVCEKEGIDYYELRKNANHEFCNLHLPGNVGGHCIPVYPWFLINKLDVPLIKKAREINDSMIEYYADKIGIKEGKIAVLGLTYRDNVKELAYTRSIPMINLLQKRGYDVYASDPMYDKNEIEKLGVKFTDRFEEMDGIILMNSCEKYKERLKLIKDRVIDTKGILK